MAVKPHPKNTKTPGTAAKARTASDRSRAERYGEFVEFFYQVHYRLGMTLEVAMCNGVVSRTQGAILWLVASEIGRDQHLRRKDVERRLREWYETSNSNVSKLLRDLAKPPRCFIVQKESPDSGREKVISLTPEGAAFVREMKVRGCKYFDDALAHLSGSVMTGGAEFFEQLFSVPLPPAGDQEQVSMRRGGAAIRRRR